MKLITMMALAMSLSISSTNLQIAAIKPTLKNFAPIQQVRNYSIKKNSFLKNISSFSVGTGSLGLIPSLFNTTNDTMTLLQATQEFAGFGILAGTMLAPAVLHYTN